MHDIAGGRYARRTHLLRCQIPITVRVCHSATGAQVAADMRGFRVRLCLSAEPRRTE